MTASNPPTSWTQTGRRASEGDAFTTTTPPLVGPGAAGEGTEASEGRQDSHPHPHSDKPQQHQTYPPLNHPSDKDGRQELTGSKLLSVDEVGIAGNTPLPPTMTRARSSNEISIVKTKPKVDDNDEAKGGERTERDETNKDAWMEGRLRSLAARAEGIEPSASFPVALEKARSRRERELDGRRQDGESEDTTGERQVYESSPSPVPHGRNSFPLLNAGQNQAGTSNPGQEDNRSQVPLVLPDYLLPMQAGSERASNRPDLMDLGAYQRMQQQQHGFGNGGNGNPYNGMPHGHYSGITPPSSSHSPVSMMYPVMQQQQRGDHGMDYPTHPNNYASGSNGPGGSRGGMASPDSGYYRPTSATGSTIPSPYETMGNPYLTNGHTPPLAGMYGQPQAYYNPYSSPHNQRGAFLGSPVNSPSVSPAMGMKPWLPPLDDDPSITIPGPQTSNAILSSPPLSPTMASAQAADAAGGWSNGWQGQSQGMNTAGGGQAGFYGIPSWDHDSRAGGVGSGMRGGRTGRGETPRNGEPNDGNGTSGRPGRMSTGPGGGAGFRPAQPGHTSSFGTAVQNMPVEGYPGNGYGNVSQGGYNTGPSGYAPYQTGYYAGLPSYLGYAQMAEATRPMMPPPMTSQYSNGRGGRAGGQSGRRSRWSAGGNGHGPAPGPLHQVQGHRAKSPEGRDGHRANAKSMTSINDVFEQMVIGTAAGGMQDSTMMAGPASPGQEDKRAAGRKHYHPAAPPNRSEWVMWVGNVPSNATHEEMWKFFKQPIPREAIPASIPYKQHIEVSSIFLISRSSCAFVNLETQDELLLAITYFNHRLLRPLDPRCPKLVCRVRKMDDDLKAGVGGQRGAGIHTKYVQDMLARQKAENEAGVENGKTPEPEDPLSPAAEEFPPDGEGRRRESVMAGMVTPAAFAAWQRERSQSGTHSFASTNSSFLGRNFPKRYFILKSLTQEELETSVKTGKWKTQLHNEAILDQAFRTSPEVYLIFGANKQGNFYGWAVMRSGIGSQNRNARSISVGSRSQPPSTPSSGAIKDQSSSGSTSRSTDDPNMTKSGRPRIPHASSGHFRMTTQSPGELSPSEEVNFTAMRLPGEGNPSKSSSPMGLPSVPEAASRGNTLDAEALAKIRAGDGSGFKLDDQAPIRAAEKRTGSNSSQGSRSSSPGNQDQGNPDSKENDDSSHAQPDKPDDDGIVRHDMATPVSPAVAQAVEASGPGPAENQLAKVGTMFDVEWIKTGVLPFHRLRHLRNPWNQDKEVKVSRDGTELEPTVGALLLAEWDKLKPAPPAS